MKLISPFFNSLSVPLFALCGALTLASCGGGGGGGAPAQPAAPASTSSSESKSSLSSSSTPSSLSVASSAPASAASSSAASVTGAFIESNGLVVVEMDSVSLPTGWVKKTGNGSTGAGYIEWQGADNFNTPGVAEIVYDIKITTPGTYQFEWFNLIGMGTSLTDFNDSWLKIDAQRYYGDKAGHIVCPTGLNPATNSCVGNVPNGTSAQGWFKIYRSGGVATSFIWSTFTSDNDTHRILADFPTAGYYKVRVSARSKHHAIDRFVLFRDGSVTRASAIDTSKPESAREGIVSSSSSSSASSQDSTRMTLGAINDFTNIAITNFSPAYKDTKQNALAIDAALYKGSFAAASHVFNGASGQYDLALTTLTETDGESKYRLLVNSVLVAEVTNPATTFDYAPHTFKFKNVALNKGDTVQLEFNSATNGKIPEAGGTAYSRGRWVQLALSCVSTACGFNASSTLLGKFNTSKDLLLANFDSKPDVDDIHAVAAVGTMLSDSRFSQVNYHATAGAVGIQTGTYIDAPALFNLAFGSKWASANANWESALNTAYDKAAATLSAGGDLWVLEAGQSDFTADLVARVKTLMPAIDTLKRIHIVQHSQWNEDKTTPADLSYVKLHTDYQRIADGNVVDNGTPGFKTDNGAEWAKLIAHAKVGPLWTEARRVANDQNGKTGYNNPAIALGGLDYSDAAEAAWIFGFLGIRDTSGFMAEFLP